MACGSFFSSSSGSSTTFSLERFLGSSRGCSSGWALSHRALETRSSVEVRSSTGKNRRLLKNIWAYRVPFLPRTAAYCSCGSFLNHPQPGAAGPGVFGHLLGGGSQPLFIHQPALGLAPAHTHGEVLGADTALAPIVHLLLDDAVLQRMEGDNRQAAAGL